MCDTLCVLGREGAVFGKNSDRPAAELQLPAVVGPRPGGGRLRTQYLEIEDAGAARALLSQPDWLWGAEHGVNEHALAVGNEKVDTRQPGAADGRTAGSRGAALIGMDLVRLALERAGSAEAALEVVVGLLERHGQGGVCDRTFDQAYDSSFLLADPASAWVLETAGRTWAARPVGPGGTAAISNRLTIGDDWARASPDVPAGADFDAWRDPAVDTAYADGRLAASRAFLASLPAGGERPGASDRARRVVAHLRDHGTGPWGDPGGPGAGGRGTRPPPPPAETGADGRGITVCMHVGGVMATTASMVAALPRPGTGPLRAWLAVGSPCVSVYVPVLGPPHAGQVGADARLFRDAAELRSRVESDGSELDRIRATLDPLEGELWDEADAAVERPDRWDRLHAEAWRRVGEAARRLADRRSGPTRPVRARP
ncbi:MAG TPA: hypothetical protein VKW77_03705 [Acidimicrobiales bacterium]|nr:hypothetical protein [Acidimicrobiales bacterium]